MQLGNFGNKVNLELGRERNKFLKKKHLKERDDNMNQEIRDFSNSISNTFDNNNSHYLSISDRFISDSIDEKYNNESQDLEFNLEQFKKIMNSPNSKDFNDEESITENNLYFSQNNSTKIKETIDIQINIQKNKKMKISDEDYLKFGKRKYQKDNISQKLFKKFNDWIIKKIEKKIPNPLKKKIFPPNHDIFTHNTNLKDIRFYLDVQIKNIITMTKNDKESLDQLLIIKGIKKQRKYNETTLNHKDIENAKILLKKLKKIEKIEDNEIINLIIDILIERGYKKSDEEKKLFKKDKDNFNQLLSEYKIKKSFKNQEKNEKQIEYIEKIKIIEELGMTLRESLLIFFDSNSKEFEDFKSEVKENDEYFEYINGFSLLDLNESKTCCGFIDMIERDCVIPDEKIKILNHITNYFINKKIKKNEIDKYIELYPEKNNEN